MELLSISLVNGLIYGTLLFTISAGLTLIFGMMRILNFAHASFYMLGAYLGVVSVRILGFWASLLVVPVVIAVAGMAVEKVLLRPAHKYGHGHQLLVTFGLALVIQETVKLIFGDFAIANPVPSMLDGSAFTLFGMSYSYFRLLIVVIAVAMFSLLYVVLVHTRLGILVRAAIDKPEMVGSLGHDVSLIFSIVFGVGSWLAGMAGVVGGMYFTTNPDMGNELGVLAFVVVVVGGLGSIEGALIASFLIGCVTSLAAVADVSLDDVLRLVGLSAWSGRLGDFASGRLSSLAATAPILIMLAVLALRPAGLMGEEG